VRVSSRSTERCRGARHRARAGSRGGALALAVAVALVACDGGDDPPGVVGEDDVDEVVEGAGEEADDASTLPDVRFIDVAEVVDPGPDAEGIDRVIASAAADLPDGWEVAVVADRDLGPYVVGLPAGATVWRVGDDLAALRSAVDDVAWLAYWEPILEDASAAGESSSLRGVVSLPGAVAVDAVGGVSELHLTLSATPQQDVPVDDPQALAETFADSFREQGLTVEEASTATAGDAEVGALALTTPDDEFEDGVPRALRQWFYPDPPVLWSVTCEGPAPAAEIVDGTCPSVLASFRPPPR
jgi:hypothetical protein